MTQHRNQAIIAPLLAALALPVCNPAHADGADGWQYEFTPYL